MKSCNDRCQRPLGFRGASVLLTMAVGMLTSTGWAGEPIKVGFVSVFSGPLAAIGEAGFRGAQMAVN